MHLSVQSLRRLSLILLFWSLYPGLSFSQVVNVRAFHAQDGLGDEIVRDIVEMPDSSVWFATWGGGISQFLGLTWETFTHSAGLPSFPSLLPA